MEIKEKEVMEVMGIIGDLYTDAVFFKDCGQPCEEFRTHVQKQLKRAIDILPDVYNAVSEGRRCRGEIGAKRNE
jgi:hypothetical protein